MFLFEFTSLELGFFCLLGGTLFCYICVHTTVSSLCCLGCILGRDKSNYFLWEKYFQINLKHTFIPFPPYSICFMRSFFPSCVMSEFDPKSPEEWK